MNKSRYAIADVFTGTRFGGNQLAVFTSAADLDPGLMQTIAREINYSETTFLMPPEAGGDCRIRIFTPGYELPFAGHPMVGSAFVVLSEGLFGTTGQDRLVRIETGMGIIPMQVKVNDPLSGYATMTQPLPEFKGEFTNRKALAAALSIKESDLGETPIQVFYNGVTVIIACIKSLVIIRKIKPVSADLVSLGAEFNADTIMGFTTETVHPTSNVHCRVFAPAAGVVEDPATGSANGPLGAYLVRHGLVDAQQVTRIVSEQGFEMNRPSILDIEITTGPSPQDVRQIKVGGSVVISGSGEMYW